MKIKYFHFVFFSKSKVTFAVMIVVNYESIDIILDSLHGSFVLELR